MEPEGGFSTGFGLVAVAVTMVILAVLLLVGFNTFGATSSVSGSGARVSIISPSSAETQIKLCAEGRDSSYGDPPSQAQQSKCLTELAGQISG